jgi:methylation protein EvaC
MKKIEFLNLGRQPIANRFIYPNDTNDEYFYHLRVGMDNDTKLITHIEYVDPPLMFNENYAYRGSMSRTMVNHFTEFSNTIKQTLSPKNVLEIGSNDGVFIKNWPSETTYDIDCTKFDVTDIGHGVCLTVLPVPEL